MLIKGPRNPYKMQLLIHALISNKAFVSGSKWSLSLERQLPLVARNSHIKGTVISLLIYFRIFPGYSKSLDSFDTYLYHTSCIY